MLNVNVRLDPAAVTRARRLAVHLEPRTDTLGRTRIPTAHDAVRAAVEIGLCALERKHGSVTQ